MSDIDLKQLKALTKLSLTIEEEQIIPVQMESIVSYVDQLQEVKVASRHSHRQALTSDLLRPDEIRECDDVSLLFANMPEREGNFLVVPEVFSE